MHLVDSAYFCDCRWDGTYSLHIAGAWFTTLYFSRNWNNSARGLCCCYGSFPYRLHIWKARQSQVGSIPWFWWGVLRIGIVELTQVDSRFVHIDFAVVSFFAQDVLAEILKNLLFSHVTHMRWSRFHRKIFVWKRHNSKSNPLGRHSPCLNV